MRAMLPDLIVVVNNFSVRTKAKSTAPERQSQTCTHLTFPSNLKRIRGSYSRNAVEKESHLKKQNPRYRYAKMKKINIMKTRKENQIETRAFET